MPRYEERLWEDGLREVPQLLQPVSNTSSIAAAIAAPVSASQPLLATAQLQELLSLYKADTVPKWATRLLESHKPSVQLEAKELEKIMAKAPTWYKPVIAAGDQPPAWATALMSTVAAGMAANQQLLATVSASSKRDEELKSLLERLSVAVGAGAADAQQAVQALKSAIGEWQEHLKHPIDSSDSMAALLQKSHKELIDGATESMVKELTARLDAHTEANQQQLRESLGALLDETKRWSLTSKDLREVRVQAKARRPVAKGLFSEIAAMVGNPLDVVRNMLPPVAEIVKPQTRAAAAKAKPSTAQHQKPDKPSTAQQKKPDKPSTAQLQKPDKPSTAQQKKLDKLARELYFEKKEVYKEKEEGKRVTRANTRAPFNEADEDEPEAEEPEAEDAKAEEPEAEEPEGEEAKAEEPEGEEAKAEEAEEAKEQDEESSSANSSDASDEDEDNKHPACTDSKSFFAVVPPVEDNKAEVTEQAREDPCLLEVLTEDAAEEMLQTIHAATELLGHEQTTPDQKEELLMAVAELFELPREQPLHANVPQRLAEVLHWLQGEAEHRGVSAAQLLGTQPTKAHMRELLMQA